MHFCCKGQFFCPQETDLSSLEDQIVQSCSSLLESEKERKKELWNIWGFSKLGVPFMGVSTIRIRIFGGPKSLE